MKKEEKEEEEEEKEEEVVSLTGSWHLTISDASP
jgi:hypothetical protein